MEKSLVEDDCVDSGAETGGSDYSPLSSTSINGADLMADLQDPYLVCVHLIADPDQGVFLQRATDAALSWIHPDLQLFRVSERAHRSNRKHHPPNPNSAPTTQPALAVILFLHESYANDGEEQILSLHRALHRPPWRYHHTEKVSNGKRMLPLSPCSQDFFTLTPGTPLWAVRQVHYGKEIIRLTIYCRYENYADMVRLYKLLLQKRVAQKKEDFCFFLVYSNADLEIQLSFKRLQKGQSPSVLDSALLEVRVRDVGTLVPLLPRPCSPISELRWQTQDYDGNKILLQIQSPLYNKHSSFPLHESTSAPSTFTRHSTPYRHHHHHQKQHRHPNRSLSFHSGRLQSSQTSLPLACDDFFNPDGEWSDHRFTKTYAQQQEWKTNHSGSLFSLPSLSQSPGLSRNNHHHRKKCTTNRFPTNELVPPFRLNVDALIGAEETDVDTGDKVAMDLSVVSAYIQAGLGLNLNPRPVSAPPEDIVPSRSPSIPDVNVLYKSSTVGGRIGVNRSNSMIVNGTNNSSNNNSSCSSLGVLLGQSSGLERSANASTSSVSINHSDSCSIDEEKVEEEEEEFYI